MHSETEDYSLLKCDVYQTTRRHNAEEQSRREGEVRVTLKLNTTSAIDLLNITLKVTQTGNDHSGNMDLTQGQNITFVR